ncbi:HDIG domain-containing metalloprotein [Streptomyces sp. NPDC056921]|uniref:HDIG domain-containing metalloprotein n=1 Tax=Streptomyces sp. NPDC056921 TaxID=3345966 RepID=UPI003628C7DE
MVIPSLRDIRDLHKTFAPSRSAFEAVYSHCEIVWTVACALMKESGAAIDGDLVRAGCLLHDIGVYCLYDDAGALDEKNYIQHGLIGHELLAGEGFAESLCRFCSCHTGVGLTRSDIIAQELPLPRQDFVAVSSEEQLVMYADKFHSKTNPPRFLRAETYALHVRRFGAAKEDAFRGFSAVFGVPDIEQLAVEHGQLLV